MNTKIDEIEAYIHSCPEQSHEYLRMMRRIIRETAIDAEESISYGSAAYKYKGKPLVYFAGFKKHAGFYATPQGHETFKDELSIYKQGKGSVQFPLNQELPVELIRRIVEFKMENL